MKFTKLFLFSADGKITAVNDVQHECNAAVTFNVYVTDQRHEKVGPIVVACRNTNREFYKQNIFCVVCAHCRI